MTSKSSKSRAPKSRFVEALQVDLGCPVPFEKIFRLRRRANHSYNFARLARERDVGHRHERWARCGGREWCTRRMRQTWTAKSCGPDIPTLISSWRQCLRIAACDGDNNARSPGRA